MIAPLAACVLLASAIAPAFAADARLAVFRRTHYSLELPLVDPFERLLFDGAADLEAVENVAVDSNGGEFLFRLPRRLHGMEDIGPQSSTLDIFESPGGLVAFFPASPAFEGLFESLAREAYSYPDRKAPPFRRVNARLTLEPLGGGDLLHTLSVLDPARVRHPQWRASLAFVYRFRYQDQTHSAFFLFRTQGGEGRMAAAIARLRAKGSGDLLVLNRGEIFAYGASVTTGTAAGMRFERMGVDAAVLGAGELTRLDDLARYRAERGASGVEFLSANLVYSSNTAVAVVEPYRIFERGGSTIAVFGLTRPDWVKYLTPETAPHFTLTDPISAAGSVVERLRKKADFIVALTNLEPAQNARLSRSVPGIDIIAGDDYPFETSTRLPRRTLQDPERGPFDAALGVSADAPTVLTELALRRDGLALSVRERHILLDDSFPELDGFVKFKPSGFGVFSNGQKPLLPASRRLYPEAKQKGPPRLQARDFWNLTASLVAARTGAEVAVLPVFPISERTTGDFSEGLVSEWFQFRERLVLFEIRGSALKGLIAEVRRQERGGAVPGGVLPVVAGGVGEGDTVHGVGIDASTVYRVAATDRVLAQTRHLPWLKKRANESDGGDLTALALEELRSRAEAHWQPEQYRPLLRGRPIREGGLWSVRFRDISVNASNTKVVSDPAFAAVSNPRVRGFDEQLISGVSKIDLEYRSRLLKWTNAFELEYARSRLRPPGGTEILNTPKNRSSVLTVGTWNLASFPWHAVGRSFGPSLGFQYEGHVERQPLQRRKHVASMYPGVEFFNGTFLHSLEISGNIRRDWTPRTPVNKFGFRTRALLSRNFGPSRLDGEVGANYFIRTRADTNQDLRLEVNTVFKLHMPLWKNLTLSPFVDFYYFVLKVRPISGYSTIMGLSLNFSRIWKPQYEVF